MTVIVTLQNAMKIELDLRIVELKTLLERTPWMLIALTLVSTSGTPEGDSTSEGRKQFVRILSISVRLPSRIPIDQTEFIKVNLTVF